MTKSKKGIASLRREIKATIMWKKINDIAAFILATITYYVFAKQAFAYRGYFAIGGELLLAIAVYVGLKLFSLKWFKEEMNYHKYKKFVYNTITADDDVIGVVTTGENGYVLYDIYDDELRERNIGNSLSMLDLEKVKKFI